HSVAARNPQLHAGCADGSVTGRPQGPRGGAPSSGPTASPAVPGLTSQGAGLMAQAEAVITARPSALSSASIRRTRRPGLATLAVTAIGRIGTGDRIS